MRETLTLDNLGGGAAQEQFNHELSKVLANILDPNTKPTALRGLTLTVKFKPDEDREMVDVEVNCSSKLATIKPFPTQIYMSVGEDGQAVAMEYNPKQMHMKDQLVEESENVVRFKREERSE